MPDEPRKIGGEYGDVRANIDVENLVAYLVKNVSSLKAPIDVKQFKVSNTMKLLRASLDKPI
jgi:hypothetical protein